MAAIDDPEERGLVGLLRAGDPAAFRRVYALHNRGIFTFLLRLSARREVAEDLAQETWLRFARSAPRISEDTRLAPYVFTIALNAHRSHRRWAALDVSRLLLLGLAEEKSRPREEEATDARFMLRSLTSAIAKLRTGDREILLLVGVHGFEPKEAAQVLQLSPEALRARLSRARERLREQMFRAEQGLAEQGERHG